MKISLKYVQARFKQQGSQVVFVFSLLALTLLVAWWSVFINRSIAEAYELKHESVTQSADIHAFTLGHNKFKPPETGLVISDPRLEIVMAKGTADVPGEYVRELLPFWKGFFIRTRQYYLQKIRKKRASRRIMVAGESSLLVFLLLVSGFMIYRMYSLEKRTTLELHELWSRVSHEIKTPITGVKAFLETIQHQPLNREDILPLIPMALKQVERQQQLAENMLVGQKLRHGGIGIHLKRVSLGKFLRDYLEHHTLKLSSKQVRLELPGDNDVVVMADPEALRIIFDNITDNAIKYVGDELLLNIQVDSDGRRGTVTFKDNGPGFAPGMKNNLFKAYRRFSDELPGGSPGTGMGLHISRQLAQAMGGNLTAYSGGKNQGASFILSLKLD